MKSKGIWTALTFLAASSGLWAQNAVTPGRITAPYPTITNLAVEWEIRGDDNLNATCGVQYRRAGESGWHEAMPLVRVPEGDTGVRSTPTYRWLNKFSGSIFDLRPGTEYEIKLSLRDPDGGAADTTLKVSTRPVPGPAPDSRVIEVNPRTFVEAAACAQPGDILLLTPGYYREWTAIRDGRPGRPIVIRADRAHPMIGSTFDGIDLQRRKHVILDGLTVHGSIDIRGCEDVAVRYCKVFSLNGIVANRQPGCKNSYIADNEVSWIIPWANESIGSGAIWGGPANLGEGIEITGPGNVIAFNRVSGFRDCISLMEDLWVYDQVCIDIYNNDIHNGPDDAIEADFAMHNCRILRNRITNCGMGLSAQPGLGGPNYFIRNVMYNTAMAPYKLERKSYGSIFLHNTSIQSGDGLKEHHGQDEYFRTVWLNNIAVGGAGGGPRGRYSSGPGLAVALPGFNSTCTLDYNAVGTHGTPFAGLLGSEKFETIEGLNKLSGGQNVRIGMDSFRSGVEFPEGTFPEREPQDLTPSAASPVVGAAMLLPNVNDRFSGKGPDIGAVELGAEPEHYGPRPPGVDELTEWERRNGK